MLQYAVTSCPMRVLAEQIASSALSSDHNQRSTSNTETMDPNRHTVQSAQWHRDALGTTEMQSPVMAAQELKSDIERDANLVTLDDIMMHQNRFLHSSDGFERSNYLKEVLTEEGESSSARRDSLGSPADSDNLFDTIMQHQNRILHHSDGFMRDDYLTEKSSAARNPLSESEGSSIFS